MQGTTHSIIPCRPWQAEVDAAEQELENVHSAKSMTLLEIA
jgi:hypothetical protein